MVFLSSAGARTLVSRIAPSLFSHPLAAPSSVSCPFSLGVSPVGAWIGSGLLEAL
jgi:hypothetical protein